MHMFLQWREGQEAVTCLRIEFYSPLKTQSENINILQLC